LACGQRILDQDPLREEIHRDMMRLYLENGQRALAVRQYELCRECLRRELGISPMAETQQLSAQIVQDMDVSPGPAESSQELVQQLRLALQGFNQAQQQLQQAIQVAERFLTGHKQERPRSDSSSALPTSTSRNSSRP
jgi:DNA-binding SARP family transcriptional activator